MMNNNQGIKVACRKCGKQVNSTELVLDGVYKMMVCPNCVKERKTQEAKKASAPEVEDEDLKIEAQQKKPVGWDAEDELLNRAAAEKERQTVKVEKLDGSRVKYSCPKCKYTFVYDTIRRFPSTCPYCSTTIFRFKI
jgi:DNA-directed RNA polymerase subunit RPC12/RpoP